MLYMMTQSSKAKCKEIKDGLKSKDRAVTKNINNQMMIKSNKMNKSTGI